MRNTINIHAGVLPYYRGSSSNFWCIADERLELVGVTVYSLIVGVDSGPILFHSIPRALSWDPFELGMEAVKGFHLALVNHIMSRTLFGLCAENQDRPKQLRHSNLDAQVAACYLNQLPSRRDIREALLRRDEQLQYCKTE